MTSQHNRSIPRDQQGAVLFIALIMLVVLSLIGIASMQVTTLQERMAGNYYTQTRAFDYAEWMTRAWENKIEATVSSGRTFPANDNSCPGTYTNSVGVATGSADAWAAAQVPTAVGGTMAGTGITSTTEGDMVPGSWTIRRVDQCDPGSSLTWPPNNPANPEVVYQIVGANNDGAAGITATGDPNATAVSVTESVFIP